MSRGVDTRTITGAGRQTREGRKEGGRRDGGKKGGKRIGEKGG